jgi:hypothetical protein
MQGSDWADWIEVHLPRSPPFAAAVDELRQLAAAPHERTTGALVAHPYEELALLKPLADRERARRAWRSPPQSGGYSYEHVRAYMSKLRSTARRFLGHAERAGDLHEYVRRGSLILPPSGHPARFEGAVASRLAAYVTGASYALGGATAIRECWRSHRPKTWRARPLIDLDDKHP